METVREQLVKRPRTKLTVLTKIGVCGAAIILAAIGMTISMMFGGIFIMAGLLFAALVLFGGYNLAMLTEVEYEYCIAGSFLTVDKLINQGKRKTLCAIELKSAESFHSSRLEANDSAAIIATGDGQIYTIIYTDPKYGRTYLYFTPDERTLSMISKYLPRLS